MVYTEAAVSLNPEIPYQEAHLDEPLTAFMTSSRSKPSKQRAAKAPLPETTPLSALPLAIGEAVPASPSLSGNFRRHRGFYSTHLRHKRDLLIWLPPNYATDTDKHYPVLYMHDGNNIFDSSTAFIGIEWQVDEHLQCLIGAGQLEELIVVGVYNSPEREDEYTWTPMLQDDGVTRGGDGPQYARFLVEELKPYVDEVYRTRPEREHTAVAGSSLGGLISFYLGLYYSHVFGKIGILSPSLWWNGGEPIEDAARMPEDLRIWVDMGTNEGSDPEATIARVQAFVQRLQARGYVQGENLAFVLDSGAGHNEAAWAERVDQMLLWFFGFEEEA